MKVATRTAEDTGELRKLEVESHNRALLEAIPDTMCLLSADGVFLDCRSPDPSVTLAPPKRGLGKRIEEVLPPRQAAVFRTAIATALSTGTLHVFEYSLPADGNEVHFDARVVPCGARSVLAIVRDVTAHKRADEELRLRSEQLSTAVKTLERASRAKDEFLASTSHELRTPLNGILGMAHIVKSGIQGPVTDKQLRSLDVIEEGARHLLALINDILDVAKIEAGRLPLQIEPCSVLDVCEAGLSMVRQTAEERRIELALAIEPEAGRVRADARRLTQILADLLSNAVKFTPKGGRVAVEVSTDSRRREIRFVVSDTGVGIAKEDLPRLFQPFTQLDARLAREYGGTGLGLTLVRRMAELHGGRVDVASVKGEGSRFTVYLPWTPAPEPLAAVLPAAPSPAACCLGAASARSTPRTILLVEDDPAAVEVLSIFLPAAGYRLEVALNGPQALEMAGRIGPDIVLMDIQLPGMDGLEVIRRLRSEERFHATPVIAVTALAMTGDREKAISAGADEYLSKPVPLETLEATIRALLARRPS